MRDNQKRRCLTVLIALSCCSLAVGGCATPVEIERVDPRAVHRQLTSNVLATGEFSDFTQNLLRLGGVTELSEDDPEAARGVIHDAVVSGIAGPNALFALSELSFKHATEGGGQPYYLASAVYAYAYLFPEEADEPPSPFDPRFRWAVDLYNRALTQAFATPDGMHVEPRSGAYALPFGHLQVTVDPQELIWGDRRLTDFAPAAEFEVSGLRNRYRQPGLGAPLAAASVPLHPAPGFQVAPRLRAPVTALLRIDHPRPGLATGDLHASLEVFAPPDAEETTIAGREVPLESELTASLAYGLSDPRIWATELQGFLLGDLLRDRPGQLVALQPHRPGRFPVVFVHGTYSSSGRWADMINDLLSDPKIRNRFEFWFFSYETGNPIPYSALRLRETLEEAVAQLDPEGSDPALRNMVVAGHSQGGLLAKMIAIDAGSRLWDKLSRRPLDELRLEAETRDLLRRAFFIEPLPSLRRVIFIATPHRGSYLAEYSLARVVGDLVRLPFGLLRATGDIVANNPDAFRFDPKRQRFGSIYGMTPGSPLITALADIPVAPGIATHSIIAMAGDGPLEEGSDGVVRYASAHIDGVKSERVVRSGHTVQGHPEAVLEVRRILFEHAEQTCREQGVGCPERPALVSETR